MTASAAISGYSATLQVGNAASPEAFLAFAEVTRITGIGVNRDTIEVSHLTSDDEWKEFIYGMNMTTNFGCEVNFLPIDTTHDTLIGNVTAAAGVAYVTYRLVLPDYGAVTKVTTVIGSAWAAAAHGYLTGQAIRLTTTGTLPTGVTGGRKVYWLRRTSANAYTLHLTPAAAFAGTGAVSTSDGGSGTHTANGTSTFSFRAACSGFSLGDITPNDKLSGTVQFSASGATTVAPA
jgi:predicted secreted protein